MCSRNKQRFSWLLVLIMAISPVQVTMAIDVDQDSHGERCHMPSKASTGSSHDSVDSGTFHVCGMGHGDNCKDHAGCAGQFNSSTMSAPQQSLFFTTSSTHKKFTRYNEDVETTYPSCLKRPPKA